MSGGNWQSSTPKPVGVPRRFGIATLMLITFLYALLFGLLRAVDAHPALFISIVVFVTGVGLAQAVLFGGKRPRQASVIAGLVLFPLVTMGSAIYFKLTTGDRHPTVEGFACIFFSTLLFGAPLGYAAGVACAGIFLWVERDRREVPASGGIVDAEVVPEITEGSRFGPRSWEPRDGPPSGPGP